ncbi:MAG: metal ABC transporter substrate-binding protein [Oscillospiraceae bacterium]|nr:metal ABC transporter substrate-binding protein [Oscillospiraceae bacterium]
MGVQFLYAHLKIYEEGGFIKKLIVAALSILLVIFPLTSCSNTETEKSGKLSIISTIFPYYDFTREITGDKADVNLLIPPGCEPHDFDFSPKDIVKINNADIFIYNGGESDSWVESILENIDSSVKVIKCFDYINPLFEDESALESEEEHHHDEDEEEYDEHIWTSPKNAINITKAISKEIINSDKQNKDYYNTNSNNYLKELKSLDKNLKTISNSADNSTLVFADRFPFLYLTEDYNFEHLSAFPGCSSQTQPSIKTVTAIIDYVNKNNIPVVFKCDFSSDNFPNIICEDSNAKIGTLYSCHNISKEMFENGESYISLMEKNCEIIKEAVS